MSTEPLPSSAPPFPCSGRREIFSGGGAPRIPLVVASRQRPSPSPGPSLPPRVMEPSRDRSCSSTRACGWRPRRGVREEWAWCMSARPPARIGRRACFRGGAREGKLHARSRRHAPPAVDSPCATHAAAVPVAVGARSSRCTSTPSWTSRRHHLRRAGRFLHAAGSSPRRTSSTPPRRRPSRASQVRT